MRKLNKNIEHVVDCGLCTGCGTCAGICPCCAITIERISDLYQPRVDSSKCNGCGICLDICPGHSIDLNRIGNLIFKNSMLDVNLGHFLSCFTGYSTDYSIRYHSASGGIASQLLIFLIENGFIDGALVTRMSKNNPLEPEVIIAKTKEEIIQGQSSKYCPVPASIALKEIIANDGKYAVVGLPCHIHGFRKASSAIPALKKKIFIYLGLYCGASRNFGATEYLFKRLGIEMNNIDRFAYRDEGCLGDMVVSFKDKQFKKYPFKIYYPLLRSFFIPFRCTLCVDHTAELADISLGDIHIPEYWDDKIGTSSIIVRSVEGERVLNHAQKAGRIFLENVDSKVILRSQESQLRRKRKELKIRFAILRLFGVKLPNYDYVMPEITPSDMIKHFLSTVTLYLQIAIGRRRNLWFLIKYLDIFGKKIKKEHSERI